ncbi:MAG TPA: hypothetical protein VK779_07345, partial [Rhizomicrobium sp.]|nr:hypothetical protein [Rhizomicrobium sp.]
LILLADSNLSLDWGVNGALLFGKQKTMLDVENRHHYLISEVVTHGVSTYSGFTRGRNRIIPNLGANAALSFNLPAAKVTVGYRADFFFGGIDGGVDSYRNVTRAFYGPFATVSVGIGG